MVSQFPKMKQYAVLRHNKSLTVDRLHFGAKMQLSETIVQVTWLEYLETPKDGMCEHRIGAARMP